MQRAACWALLKLKQHENLKNELLINENFRKYGTIHQYNAVMGLLVYTVHQYNAVMGLLVYTVQCSDI